MAKKQAKPSKKLTKKQIIFGIGFLAGLTLIYYAVSYARAELYSYRMTRDQSSMVSIREMVLLAVNGLKTNAPVEPKTGDTYFPQAKIMLPDSAGMPVFTYYYDSETKELSISTRQIYSRTASKLYAAQNMNELFGYIPKLQACQRGITLGYKPVGSYDTAQELKQIVKLASGKTLYIYLDKGCPELEDTANFMASVREY